MAAMMETQAGDAGAFARFDLNRVPSPCFVVDAVKIADNLRILRDVADRSGARVLGALKAFSMHSLGDMVGGTLHGTCASGLYEARLAREFFGGELATFSAGYKDAEIEEIVALSDHIIFNSPAQKNRFMPVVMAARANGQTIHVGLRINPEHSEGEIAKYDPCAPCSRLGTPVSQLTPADMVGVDGVHMHTLCEQGFEPLARTWDAVRPHLEPYFATLSWVNFGGGHHITRADYDRDGLVNFLRGIRNDTGLLPYIEPGEAMALDAGILVGEVLDLPQNGMNLAIMDISATCHMPDVIEAPYRPAMMGEPDVGTQYRLGGPSCLAGDVIGDYRFPTTPAIGTRIAFLDQAHYSMVKTNTFNGVALPAIALWQSDTDGLRMIREFAYADFRDRLS